MHSIAQAAIAYKYFIGKVEFDWWMCLTAKSETGNGISG
jgi:hypothetical protein